MKRFKIGQKPMLSSAEALRRRFLRFKIVSLSAIGLLVIGIIALLYANYDYIMFRLLIASNYSHSYVIDDMFEERLGFVPDRHSRYFDALVIDIVTEEIRRVGGDVYTFLYTPTERDDLDERIRRRAEGARMEEVAPGVVQLVLPNISPYIEDFVFNNRDDLNSFDNLILDLRGNNGGELAVSQAIAGLFLERRAIVGTEQARMDFWPFTRARRSRGAQFFEFDNIVILQNHRTASAAESLIAALQYN
ncbi:MAG: S41 family peptidase, partial [Defluviitaleaceae bacterium]|nr:S41 family peptidase [Defluviitaleaceae bacterium]